MTTANRRAKSELSRPTLLFVAQAMAGGLLLSTSAVPALAQTASQITPPSFRPEIEKSDPEAAIVIPDNVGSQPPAGSEALSVTVGSLQFEGGTPELADRTAALEASLSGRQVAAAELFAAARTLEADYARAGYVLVRVVLPPQTLTDGGVVRFVVMDGRIERIDASAVPEAVRARVEGVLRLLVGAPGVTLAMLERRLLLAGDAPGAILRSALRAGTSPGSSVLVVEARYKPVTGSLSADNTLAEGIGGHSAGLGLQINSPTGHGELVYLQVSGDLRPEGGALGDGVFAERPRNRSLAAGLVLPLGDNGLALSLEGVTARTTPRVGTGELSVSSRFQRMTARLRYPVVRSRAFTLNVEGGLDAQDELVEAIAPLQAELSHDVLRIVRVGGDLSYGLPGGGAVEARIGASFGIDGLGARAAPPPGSNDTPLSRQGAGPQFRKLEASIGFSRPLAPHLDLTLRARGQTAFGEALPNAEQIGLASLDGLSSFDSGLIQGDAGYVVRSELRFPFVSSFTLPFVLPDLPAQRGAALPTGDTTSGAVVLSPYVFAAVGGTWLDQPTALERGHSRGLAYGVGLRFGAAARSRFTGLSGSLEYGRAELSGAGPGQAPDGDRITASFSLAF